MKPYLHTPLASKWTTWISYAMSILPILLLFFSATMKFIQPAGFAEGLEHMGWNGQTMTYIGIIEACCAIIYLIPQTSILGAILLTGYMGGAIATHVRVGDPVYFQILVGVMLWGGLFLREPRIRALIPFRG